MGNVRAENEALLPVVGLGGKEHSPAHCQLGLTVAGSTAKACIPSRPCNRYARICRCAGHSSYLKHVDWSLDSRILQSNCGAYELLYFEAVTGKQVRLRKGI